MATFGNTTAATTHSAAYADYQFLTRFQLSEAGSITALTAYMGGASTTCRLLLYDDDGSGGLPGTRLASVDVSVGSSAAWVSNTLGAAYSAAAGYYWLSVHLNGGAAIYASANADASDSQYIEDLYSDGSLADVSGETNYWDKLYCIYATYTPTASGLLIPAAMHYYRQQ